MVVYFFPAQLDYSAPASVSLGEVGWMFSHFAQSFHQLHLLRVEFSGSCELHQGMNAAFQVRRLCGCYLT